jgi:hypothetical protein
LPGAAVNAAPYAQYSNNAALSDSALDVANGSIDEIDIATGAVSARTIATSAVGNSEIDFDAVTSSKIATDAVGASEISTGAVGSSEIAAGAVGNAELASNSVGVSKLIGASYVSPSNLNATIGANSCGTFDIGVTGGFEPGDFVVLNTTTTFPANVMVQPLEVVSTNLVKVRFCNNGTSSATLSNEGIRMMSVR